MLNAASLSLIATFSIALTDHPSINTLHMLSHSVKNHSSRISPTIPFTFSDIILNNIVDSASPCFKPLSVSHKAFTYSEVPDPMLKTDMNMPYFSFYINLLKSTSYVMHQQFNILQLYALPTLYLCVLRMCIVCITVFI